MYTRISEQGSLPRSVTTTFDTFALQALVHVQGSCLHRGCQDVGSRVALRFLQQTVDMKSAFRHPDLYLSFLRVGAAAKSRKAKQTDEKRPRDAQHASDPAASKCAFGSLSVTSKLRCLRAMCVAYADRVTSDGRIPPCTRADAEHTFSGGPFRLAQKETMPRFLQDGRE